jgi:hypothetical protein
MNVMVNVRNVEAQEALPVSLHMLYVDRNFKTLRTLSSTTSHMSSTFLRYSEIAADLFVELTHSFISTLGCGLCTEQKHFRRIN